MKRLGLLLLISLMLGTSGCGIFRDTKLEEIYNNIVSRYNGYFNARMLMQDVVEEVRNNHKDNFNEILAVHQFPDEDQAKQLTPRCDKIIKKCTRVLQKHDETKWSDDCYFLMAKARFYKGEYTKAIQMFRYVNSKYKKRPTADKALVWLVYTYLQQDDLTDARAMLTNIQSQNSFPEAQQYKLRLAEAAVAIRETNYQTAHAKLTEALPAVKNNDLAHRYRFIMAQTSQEQDDCRQAIQTYNIVLSSRTRYELAFHAKINKAACFKEQADEAPRRIAKVKEDLKAMLKDDKNVDYKSRIYFELARLARGTGNTQGFLKYLNKALKTQQASAEQKAAAYRSLAQYHYSKNHFSKAKAYFDSTFRSISEEAEGYLALKRKKDVLDELIAQRRTIRIQDSLQQMAQLPKSELKKHFSRIISKAEQQKQQQQQQRKRDNFNQQRQRLRNQRNQRRQQVQRPSIGNSESSWYFYNEASKGRGLPKFKARWDNRPLQDFWRTRTKQQARVDRNDKADTSNANAAGTDTNRQRLAVQEMLKKEAIPDNYKKLPESEQRFYAQLPLGEQQRELSRRKTMKARYELGRIYYQDLKANQKARKAFTTLNQDNPGHPNKPASLYYLHKIHKEEGRTDSAAAYRQRLIDQHPESDYAQILQRSGDEQQTIETSNKQLEQFYTQTYRAYQQARCDTVRQRWQRADSLFDDNYLAAKLQYLAILCEGKHQDTEQAFKQKLKTFVNKRRGSAVASHAENVYNYLKNDGQLSGGNQQQFPFEEAASKRHVYFLVINLQKQKSAKVTQNLADYNKKYYQFLDLSLSTTLYSQQKQALVVKDFEDKNQAMRYLQSLANDKDFLKSVNIETPNHFVATKGNYRKVLKEDKLQLYDKFFQEQYQNRNP